MRPGPEQKVGRSERKVRRKEKSIGSRAVREWKFRNSSYFKIILSNVYKNFICNAVINSLKLC